LAERKFATISNLLINSEKARSEDLIGPVLYGLSKFNPNINVFSGENLNANFELDLNGECDFILTSEHKPILQSPIFGLLEAKKSYSFGIWSVCSSDIWS